MDQIPESGAGAKQEEAARSERPGEEQGSPFRFPVKSRCLPETEFRSEISVNFGEFRWILDEIC